MKPLFFWLLTQRYKEHSWIFLETTKKYHICNERRREDGKSEELEEEEKKLKRRRGGGGGEKREGEGKRVSGGRKEVRDTGKGKKNIT